MEKFTIFCSLISAKHPYIWRQDGARTQNQENHNWFKAKQSNPNIANYSNL